MSPVHEHACLHAKANKIIIIKPHACTSTTTSHKIYMQLHARASISERSRGKRNAEKPKKEEQQYVAR